MVDLKVVDSDNWAHRALEKSRNYRRNRTIMMSGSATLLLSMFISFGLYKYNDNDGFVRAKGKDKVCTYSVAKSALPSKYNVKVNCSFSAPAAVIVANKNKILKSYVMDISPSDQLFPERFEDKELFLTVVSMDDDRWVEVKAFKQG